MNELGGGGRINQGTPDPLPDADEAWGSDLVAEVLQRLGIPYLAVVPGSSLRGLHDSIVNRLGNRAPQLLLTVHEETAVAIAHGFAKVTDRIMAAAVHANVGLMRATMGLYNAWCDRAPLLLLGASGPRDATRRRAWIDWIHTSSDQGALVRNFTKWDDQPASAIAAVDALLRATQIAGTAPRGPVYVNLDISLQETKLAALPPLPDVSRYAPPPSAGPLPRQVTEAARLLSKAERPVILAGRCSRSTDAWKERIALAEKLGAPVLTTSRLPAAFPTDHPLHAMPPALYFDRAAEKMIAAADVVLSLDWIDLAGALRTNRGASFSGRVIHISPDAHSHRGWSADYQSLPPVDLYMICEADAAVPLLRAAVVERKTSVPLPRRTRPPPDGTLTLRSLADSLATATEGMDVCYTRLPLSWSGEDLHWRHPLDYIGHDGGAGIGSGPGMAVGAGLALRGTGRIPIALVGDGDFLMGNTAIWTAVHYQIPLLIIVCNNGGFFTDEQYQSQIAEWRHRPAETAWVGHRLESPEIDIAAIARAQGALGIGPITLLADLQQAAAKGVAEVAGGGVCVIDIHVPRGPGEE